MSSKEDTSNKLEKDLEELRNEYEEFVYTVSHDLIAPFRQIEGFLELLSKNSKDSLDEKGEKYLNLSLKGAAKGKGILKSLVAYSRLNNSSEPFTSIDLNTVFEEARESLSSTIDEKKAKISSSLLPSINADKEQLYLLFFHLLQNALIYQDINKTPEITLTFEEGNNEWIFELKDNGIGIAKNLWEKIFKPLRRAVSDEIYPGLGMGLTITAKILKKHQGSIWIESIKGEGSSFFFTLPR